MSTIYESVHGGNSVLLIAYGVNDFELITYIGTGTVSKATLTKKFTTVSDAIVYLHATVLKEDIYGCLKCLKKIERKILRINDKMNKVKETMGW